MWFIRWLFTLLLMIYAVLFAALNLDPITLSIPYLPVIETPSMSKAVFVLLAVGLGVVIWAIVSFIGSIEFRRRVHHLERINHDLKVEVTNLRNKSILDDSELEGGQASVVKQSLHGALDLPPYDYERVDDLVQSRNAER